MFIDNRHIKIISRVCLIGIYVAFFSVQLNLHFGAEPAVSFFTGDFISQQSNKTFHSVLSKDNHKDSKSKCFRLNKRFHPSHLFTAPDVLQDLVKYSFSIESPLLNDTQPLTSFSFNSPSLRGPPAQVV
jgi:hypothetical protein